MKKLFVILLLLSYGLSSFGMTLYVHYCCGKIDKVDLVPVENTQCPIGKKATKKGCCDDRQVELKIKTNYKNEASAWLKCKGFNEVLFGSDFFTAVFVAKDEALICSKVISPPFDTAIPIYKMNCIYRI